MGLDYSYILYFNKEDMWTALQAVVDIAVPHHPPTKILLPDRQILIPLETWSWNNRVLDINHSDIDFMTSIYFEEDDAIFDYLTTIRADVQFRSPPEDEINPKIPIGYIYLTIRNENSTFFNSFDAKNIIAFDFGTTGTKMSMLFYYSESIRHTFITLLERVPGICGVFNNEEYGHVFWYKGRNCDFEVDNPFLPPAEIKRQLNLE